MTNGFTPTQQRIMDLLSDGKPHCKDELQKCLSDELAGDTAVGFHLTAIRKVLSKRNEGVLCVLVNRKIAYRYVALRGASDKP